MWNSFPYDSWLNPDGTPNEGITDFWTFGPANSTGTYILTVLGCILMVAALIGWVWLEKQKLERQAAALRAPGAFDQQTAAGPQATSAGD